MAKGNMLLGYSRGAVGDIVFARSKGQQVARARNRNPNNPNTEAQVLQRSRFAAAQRFFQLANSQFFKFAYEDKTERESDYNAFMRHNVGMSPYILREMTRKVDYPAFAPWLVTQGSLPVVESGTADYVGSGADAHWSIANPFGYQSQLLAAQTVADMSSVLIASGDDWREGDIITILVQYSPYGSYPLAVTSGTSDVMHYMSFVSLQQLMLNTQDARPLSTVVQGLTNVDFTPYFNGDVITDEHAAISYVVIHSRNTSSGLKVSTQTMLLNLDAQRGTTEGALASYNFTRSADYEGRILQSWDAASKAVLQGAKASEFVPPEIYNIRWAGVPYTSYPFDVEGMSVDEEVTLVIYTDNPTLLRSMLKVRGGINFRATAGATFVDVVVTMVTGDGTLYIQGQDLTNFTMS